MLKILLFLVKNYLTNGLKYGIMQADRERERTVDDGWSGE